jgi:hypothetical protein
MCVFLGLIAKMSDHFLEQQVKIKFFVKLGENASDSCAVLSEAYRGEAMKKSVVFLNGINGLHVEITDEDSAYHFL